MYVESPTGLAELTQAVGGQLAGYGRSLLLLILGVGAFFVGTVVLSDILIRRRDLGRRRTLGATAPISPPWSPFAPSPPPPSVHWSAASPRVSSTPVRATRPHWTSPWPLPFLLC